MDRSGEIFDGRYRLLRRLGQGGMAAVYAARDGKLDKAVAVKVLAGESAALPRVAQRFVQEARAVSRIRHDNVVDVTDVGVTAEGSPYLVMELLRGEDLAATLAREGPLPWARVGPIALQICAALAAAHRAGVVHRDIKPSNCFRVEAAGETDVIKVLDFGIARILDPDARIGEPTTAGTVLGTPEYIAPEVAAGEPAGPSSDLYAVGALIYKLLTGVAPFTGSSFHAVLSKQIFEPPISPRRRAPGREIPEAVEALVLRALAKQPAQRQTDMAELAAEIVATLADLPDAARWSVPAADASTDSLTLPPAPRSHEPVTAPEPTRAPPRGATLPLAAVPRPPLEPRPHPRRPWLLGLGAAAAALAGVLVGARLALSDPEDMPRSAGAIDQARSDMPDPPAYPAPPSAGADEPAARAPASAALAPGPGASAAASRPAESSPSDMAKETPTIPAVAEARRSVSGARATRPGRGEPASPTPRFDVGAAARALDGAAAVVRACALDSSMMRGEIRLRIVFDGEGRTSAVEAAAGARAVEPAALRCIRRELGAIRLAPVAGELVHPFAI